MKLIEHGCPNCGGDIIRYYEKEPYSCLMCSRDYDDTMVAEILEHKRAVYREMFRPRRQELQIAV